MRFIVHKWNMSTTQYGMLILTESDIESESDIHIGAGYEILILPSKYKNISSKYLDTIRLVAEVRKGEVIYI